MSDRIANYFLFFSHLGPLICLFLIGFVAYNRRLFFQTACLSLFSIILNVALKGTFKVPLAASLGKVGYAFPSGHMQLSSVFYLWIALHIPSWPLRLSIAGLLLGIAAGLIHFDYHTLSEVVAGLVTGLLLISAYKTLLNRAHTIAPRLLLSLSSLLMLYNALIYKTIPIHSWVSYGVLIIFIIIAMLINAQYKKNYFNSLKDSEL